MKLLLSKIWRWAFKSSIYLNKIKKLWRFFDLPHHRYGGHVGFRFSVVDFTILFEIVTDENVGIDTKTKSLDSLIRKIFVIE